MSFQPKETHNQIIIMIIIIQITNQLIDYWFHKILILQFTVGFPS